MLPRARASAPYVDTRTVLESIAYHKGFLFASGGGQELADMPVQIVKYEKGYLLVRVESSEGDAPEGALIELQVPHRSALVRVEGRLARKAKTNDGSRIFVISVDDVGLVQRRLKERFPANFPVIYLPLRAGSFVLSVAENRFGVGRTTDLSLGGMQLVTPLRLTKDLIARFEVRMPGGLLEAEGKIVSVRGEVAEGTLHGIKFLRMSGLSSQRLARFVLANERRQRMQEQAKQAVGGRSRSASDPGKAGTLLERSRARRREPGRDARAR